MNEDETLPELFFEEVTENGIVYFRRGRCNDFFANKVGENSYCVDKNISCSSSCRIKGNKGKELFRSLRYFTGKEFKREDWDVLNPSNIFSNVIIEVMDGESKERCFCTQTIHQLRYALYKPKNQLILIGSECVNKFLGKEKQKVADGNACMMCNNVLDKRKEYHRDGYCSKECQEQHLYRKCIGCEELSILKSKSINTVLCNPCLNLRKNFRKCEKCDNLRVPVEEPKWKTVCKYCYVTGKDTYRNCIGCLLPKIEEYKPEWIKLCKDCYRNKKMYIEH